MKISTLLVLLLFCLMAIIGKKKGIKSFVALFCNYFMIAVSVVLISWHVNVPFLIGLNVLGILSINLFFINQLNVKTVSAFFATLVTLIISAGFIDLIVKYAMIQGFGEEQQDTISGFTLNIGINFAAVSVFVVAISSIGAMIDASMSISSSMYQVLEMNPDLGSQKLLNAGMKIGRDIIGTTTNTLYFALIGGYLTLMIWFKTLNYSFENIINSKIFAGEILTLLVGAASVVLVIPITALLSSYLFIGYRQRQKKTY
ncbi:MAG: YibE/F family protein [Sporolactobacillus sp.]